VGNFKQLLSKGKGENQQWQNSAKQRGKEKKGLHRLSSRSNPAKIWLFISSGA
jgi:hypothetical protein